MGERPFAEWTEEELAAWEQKRRAEAAEAERDTLLAQVGKMREALVGATASLVALLSMVNKTRLGHAARRVAASDKMFAIMLDDYQKSVDVARAALTKEPTK